jgi:hypothetical protein
MNWLIHPLIKRRRFWAEIRGKYFPYCINRTEYPWGLSQKIRPAAHFIWQVLPAAIFISLKIWPAAHSFQKNSLLNDSEMHSFQVSYSVYQFIRSENDLNSNTQWSLRHNLYQTVIMKVLNNKPFVKSNLLRYKLHNTISIPKQFIRNNVCQHM